MARKVSVHLSRYSHYVCIYMYTDEPTRNLVPVSIRRGEPAITGSALVGSTDGRLPSPLRREPFRPVHTAAPHRK